jgi:hypothetical protein
MTAPQTMLKRYAKLLEDLDAGANHRDYPEGFGGSWTKLCADAANAIRILASCSPPDVEVADPCPYCRKEMHGAADCENCGCGSPERSTRLAVLRSPPVSDGAGLRHHANETLEEQEFLLKHSADMPAGQEPDWAATAQSAKRAADKVTADLRVDPALKQIPMGQSFSPIEGRREEIALEDENGNE